MPNYYPIMLDVRERPVIVVGGDSVAAEKAAALQACGANVTAIAPEFCDELQSMAAHQEVVLRAKAYEPGDLDGAFLVVAATTYNAALTETICAETRQRGQLLNVVDVPDRCSFIIPSILRRGQLTVAVSTEGSSPGLAKRIRQRLEGLFPPAYDTYLRLAGAARAQLRRHGVSYAARDDFFGDYWESDVLERLAEGDEAGALATTRLLLQRYGVESTEIALMEGH